VGDVREEPSVDDLDRARLQDFYDELERFRAVFAKAQALVAPMIGEDAGRLDAMGKAIRKLYGPAVEPLMAHVDEVLGHAKRDDRAAAREPAAPRVRAPKRQEPRKADRALLGPVVPCAGGVRRSRVETVPRRAGGGDGSPPRSGPRASTTRTCPRCGRGRCEDGRSRCRGAADDETASRSTVNGTSRGRGREPGTRGDPRIRAEQRRGAEAAAAAERVADRARACAGRFRAPPAPESEIRITYEDPGGWGVL
jgi:hypothetical protein